MSRPTKRDLPLSENPESARGYSYRAMRTLPGSARSGRTRLPSRAGTARSDRAT